MALAPVATGGSPVVPPAAVPVVAPPATVAVVNQVYRECLAARFKRDYYQKLYENTITYAKVFDYSIGLGSAMSGGTGLGILADPKFAWICGPITTVSVLLSIAKGVWDWPGKSKFALDRIQFYSALYDGYQSLVDDIQVALDWKIPDFQDRRNALKTKSTPPTPDPYKQLSRKTQEAIQDKITGYKTWWVWT